MTDTDTSAAAKTKRETVALRDWIDASGAPLATGDEAKVAGLRYTHLTSVKRANPSFNPETDTPPTDCVFAFNVDPNADVATKMLAVFGGLTLAGNIVNSATNGAKGDPNLNPISLIQERFEEIVGGKWADRAEGGGVRYDKEKLATAIAQAKGETDHTPYLEKMANKVDPKTGAKVADDTKGAISYGAFALRNAKVKQAYDALTGGGTQIDAL